MKQRPLEEMEKLFIGSNVKLKEKHGKIFIR